MKVVLLAGGYGTRISEETRYKPKPMIEIGDMPILWHIMKYYSHFGFNEFIICAGYKQQIIKRWFSDYFLYNSDVTFDFASGSQQTIVHNNYLEPWKVTIIDTGLNTLTGGRIKRVKDYIGDEEFLLTYGDGVSNVDLNKLISFHKKSGKIATITVVRPSGRFGVPVLNANGTVTSFAEKSGSDENLVNAGYMVLSPAVFDYIEGDKTAFEGDVLPVLAKENKLSGYLHSGFWQCMDTLREKNLLEDMWNNGTAEWKVW